MKRWSRWLFFISIFLILAMTHIWSRIDALNEPVNQNGESVTVNISDGMTFKQVVVQLDKANAIEDPLVFEWYGRYVGLSSQCPGHYTIDPAWTQRRFLRSLQLAESIHQSACIFLLDGIDGKLLTDCLKPDSSTEKTF